MKRYDTHTQTHTPAHTLTHMFSSSVSCSHLTQRDRGRARERKKQSKRVKGEQCFPQTALERVERFGRSCQGTLCQAASSSALFLVWTNLAALCSPSYLATAVRHCGPLPPAARLKLGYPRLNSLLKNHLGVIPVWSQPPHSTAHYISHPWLPHKARRHTRPMQETSIGDSLQSAWQQSLRGYLFKSLRKMRSVHLRCPPPPGTRQPVSQSWRDVFHLSD